MATGKKKRIALVAHDNCKHDIVEWVEWNWKILMEHQLICTGTTGKLVSDALIQKMEESALEQEALAAIKTEKKKIVAPKTVSYTHLTLPTNREV